MVLADRPFWYGAGPQVYDSAMYGGAVRRQYGFIAHTRPLSSRNSNRRNELSEIGVYEAAILRMEEVRQQRYL